MTSNKPQNIATFAALKTSIANGEEASLKELLANLSIGYHRNQ